MAEGTVPVKTLSLPDEYQFDGWGRKFAYAVWTPLTAKSPRPPAAPAGFIQLRHLARVAAAITVKNAGHGYRSQAAAYALLSYGPDGHGGYTKSGTRYNVGASMTNVDELANAHYSNSGADTGYTATYVEKEYSTYPGDSDASHPFGHLVRFKERWQMQNAYDTYQPGGAFCTPGFIVQGVTSAPNCHDGHTVAVGDINGDGIPDLIITGGGASWAQTVFVVFGTKTGFPDPLPLDNLTGTNGFNLYGMNGLPSVATGDVNGDGVTDLIIGDSGGNNYAGYTYVVFGKKSGWAAHYSLSSIGAGNLMDGTQGVRFDGITGGWPVGDWSGYSVASGDINEDGYADVIIGAAGANSQAGYTYVVFGKSGSWGAAGNKVLNIGAGNLIDGTQGVRFDGVTGSDQSGFSVATGDFNHDGYADLIIGAPSANGSASYTGYTYVVFGKSGSWGAAGNKVLNIGAGNLIDGTQGVRFDGTISNDQSGFSVATGDVNGDGIPDIIIGSKGYSHTYVVFGKSGSWGAAGSMLLNIGAGSLIDGTQGVRFDGVSGGDCAGCAVATGDVNGDGIADIIIGAPYANSNQAGSTYAVFGKSATWGSAGNVILNTGPGNLIDGTQGARLDGPIWAQSGFSVATGDDQRRRYFRHPYRHRPIILPTSITARKPGGPTPITASTASERPSCGERQMRGSG